VKEMQNKCRFMITFFHMNLNNASKEKSCHADEFLRITAADMNSFIEGKIHYNSLERNMSEQY
jgi:hypothetical protein